MIEVEQLTKRYGPVIAVDHLTFTARPGHVTGFLGPWRRAWRAARGRRCSGT